MASAVIHAAAVKANRSVLLVASVSSPSALLVPLKAVFSSTNSSLSWKSFIRAFCCIFPLYNCSIL